MNNLTYCPTVNADKVEATLTVIVEVVPVAIVNVVVDVSAV